MKKFDKLLDFLFHTKRGLGVMLLAGLSGSMMFSGCFLTSCLSCACDEACDGCWGEMDSCINNCVSCGGECDNTLFTALFGEGCTAECNDNDCSFSCNPTDWDCSCGDSSSGCAFGCFSGCSPQAHIISLVYVNTSTGSTVSSGYVSNYNSVYAYEDDTYIGVPIYTQYFLLNGYYTDLSLTTMFADSYGSIASGYSVTDVSTLYVSVTEKYYGEARRITFDAEVDGESADNFDAFYDWFVGSIDVRVGGTISGFPEDAPEVEGYTFTGWTYNEGSVTLSNGKEFHLYNSGFNASASSYTIIANYTPVTYTVTINGSSYEADYGMTVDEFLTENNISGSDSNTLGKFLGWSYSDGGELLTGNEVITKDATLYPVYNSPVTITLYGYYGPNSGMAHIINGYYDEDNTLVKYYIGDTVTLPTPEDQAINVFDGWYLDADYTQSISSTITLSATQYTLYAKWKEVTEYSITYYIDGYSVRNEKYTYSKTDSYELFTSSSIDAYAPSGYEFVGWCQKSDLSDDPITVLPAGTYGDLKLYAKFSPLKYTIVLNAYGGDVSKDEVEVDYGFSYTLPVPTRQGYDFVGWYLGSLQCTDENGESLNVFSEDVLGTISNRTVQFNAHWTVHKYTITFVDGDGNTVLETECEYGTALGTSSELTAPEKTGYTFKGWYSGNKEFDPTALVYADCTYTATYTVNTYTITLDGNGGTINGNSTATVSIKYGETTTLPTSSTVVRSGYIFNGWKDSSGNVVAYSNGKMLSAYSVDGDSTYYAVWEAETAGAGGAQTLSVEVDVTVCDFDKDIKRVSF